VRELLLHDDAAVERDDDDDGANFDWRPAPDCRFEPAYDADADTTNADSTNARLRTELVNYTRCFVRALTLRLRARGRGRLGSGTRRTERVHSDVEARASQLLQIMHAVAARARDGRLQMMAVVEQHSALEGATLDCLMACEELQAASLATAAVILECRRRAGGFATEGTCSTRTGSKCAPALLREFRFLTLRQLLELSSNGWTAEDLALARVGRALGLAPSLREDSLAALTDLAICQARDAHVADAQIDLLAIAVNDDEAALRPLRELQEPQHGARSNDAAAVQRLSKRLLLTARVVTAAITRSVESDR